MLSSKAAQDAEAAVDLISDMHLSMDENNVEVVTAVLAEINEICPECHDRRIGTIWLAARTNPHVIEEKRISEDGKQCLDCGEYLAYYADALDALGRSEEARAMREEALEKTTNGMVILAVNDKLSEGE